jgi:NADH:ubiquinone oxidoreductase subunit 6 (subunit J)
MTTEQALTFAAFFVFAGITLVGGLLVASLRNVMHAALALMLSFFGVAGLYIILEAGFIAAVQVLVYIGAIAVLILFAIMLTRGLMTKTLAPENSQWIAALAIALLLFTALFFVVVGTHWPVSPAQVVGDMIPKIGTELVTTYVLPFEISSLLLLAALIGAIVIARE